MCFSLNRSWPLLGYICFEVSNEGHAWSHWQTISQRMTKPAPFSRVTINASSKRALPNTPFPSYFLPLFQNEAWCTTFYMGMSLMFIFILKDCALRFVSKNSQRQLGRDLLKANVRRIIATGDAFFSKYRTLIFSPESLFFSSGQREKIQFPARASLAIW